MILQSYLSPPHPHPHPASTSLSRHPSRLVNSAGLGFDVQITIFYRKKVNVCVWWKILCFFFC